MVCVHIVWWIFWRGVVIGSLLGGLFGSFILPIIGTLYGLLFGAVFGIVMGVVDAVVLGAVTHFFMDLQNPSRIIPWLRLIGMILNFMGVSLCMVAIFHLSFMIDQPLFFAIPALLAAAAIFYLCPRFVDYAVRIQQVTSSESDKPLSQLGTKPAR